MFFASRSSKRKKLRQTDVTEEERQLASDALWQFKYLPPGWQDEIVRWSRVLIAEKNWEGCSGLKITDEMRWAVAANAALCIPPKTDWYFDRTDSILIYPVAYVALERPSVHSNFEIAGEFARAGQTVYRGPVILNWKDVRAATRGPNGGNNLTVHEFSHQIDLINGPQADGLPPLSQEIDSQRWIAMMQTELNYARQMVSQGHRVYINDYGLSSASEFFAVASEYFFQTPHELAEYHPGVYQRLLEFYRVDLRDFLPTV